MREQSTNRMITGQSQGSGREHESINRAASACGGQPTIRPKVGERRSPGEQQRIMNSKTETERVNNSTDAPLTFPCTGAMLGVVGGMLTLVTRTETSPRCPDPHEVGGFGE